MDSVTVIGAGSRDAGTAAGIKLQFAADKPRTADSLREQLRGKMDEVLSGIYKDKDQRAKATAAGEDETQSLKPSPVADMMRSASENATPFHERVEA